MKNPDNIEIFRLTSEYEKLTPEEKHRVLQTVRNWVEDELAKLYVPKK